MHACTGAGCHARAGRRCALRRAPLVAANSVSRCATPSTRRAGTASSMLVLACWGGAPPNCVRVVEGGQGAAARGWAMALAHPGALAGAMHAGCEAGVARHAPCAMHAASSSPSCPACARAPAPAAPRTPPSAAPPPPPLPSAAAAPTRTAGSWAGARAPACRRGTGWCAGGAARWCRGTGHVWCPGPWAPVPGCAWGACVVRRGALVVGGGWAGGVRGRGLAAASLVAAGTTSVSGPQWHCNVRVRRGTRLS